MNHIAEEIKSYFGSSKMIEENSIMHYGKGHLDGGHSGRYPWGSGEEPYQRATDFLNRVDSLKKNGWKETPENIKNEFGLTVKEYRMEKSLCNYERRAALVSRAKELRDNGHSNTDIAKRMGVNESTVRYWFDTEAESRMLQAKKTADFLKEQVNKKGMIDVGISVEKELGISREKLDTALYMLERDGYHIYSGRVPQLTNDNQKTTQKVLTIPEKEHKDIFKYDEVKTINDYISKDYGETYEKKFTYPASMDSSRIKVLLKDEKGLDGYTGVEKDGLIEIRRGVDDLSLGKSLYSQVRILVDGDKYLKGMAVYSDNIPDGYDIVFNSNKTKREDAFKKIKNDPDNPFGSNIKDADQGGQYWYIDKNGKKKLGLINKRADENDWSEWADTLPSQFLSKQSKQLAEKQLNLAKATKHAEYDEIMSLTNPTIKKYYLDKFASECDSAAVDLKAASLPGQKYHVIIPNNTLKDNEIYAPGYESGTKLALIRYPHGGIFEIPICTVNNKNQLGKKLIGTTSMDAVCVNSKIAAQLSGADFDGDTVMCIPTHDPKGRVKILNKNPLEDLKKFSPDIYKYDTIKKDKNGKTLYFREGKEFKPMSETSKQKEMGVVSNLITDMTLGGATDKELARAVKHSMVVIDAVKHGYDYRQSYIDNDINSLQKKYQPKVDKDGNLIGYGGAATIISTAKGEQRIPKTKGQPKVNIKGKEWYDPTRPEGSLIYSKATGRDLYYADSKTDKNTGLTTLTTIDGKKITYNKKNKEEYEKYKPIMKTDTKTGDVIFTNNDGTIIYKTKMRTNNSTRMAETDDAYSLVSPKRHPMEILYADYANDMKALANKARISKEKTKNIPYNPQAKETYSAEVSSLNAKLNEALKNAVKERAVMRLTNIDIQNKKENNPTISKDDIKKSAQRSLSKHREELGAVSRKKRSIKISDKEWEAIQAGAITKSKLEQILNNSDPDVLRQKAMPKDTINITQSMINRMKLMRSSNFTLDEIANKMNLSKSTVSKYLGS